MKKLLFSLIFLVACTPQVQEELQLGGAEFITAPENNTYKIGVTNYQTEFKSDITNDRPLQYKLDDKFISFKPSGIYFDGQRVLNANRVNRVLDKYSNIFGVGVNLEMNTSGRVWEKLITIKSSDALGLIPDGVQEIGIEFEIETNFIIDGWDKKSDLEIVDKIRLGDFSYIEQASVWDSYSEEVCVDPEDESTCETLTNRQKVRTVLSKNGNKLYFTKYLPISFFETAEYPIYTDADVTYGTAQKFDTGAVLGVSVTDIDTDKFVTCYDSGDDSFCTAASVSGTVITFGSAVTVNSTPGHTCVAKVDTDKVSGGVRTTGSTPEVDGFICTVSGTTLSCTAGINDPWGLSADSDTSLQNDYCDAFDDAGEQSRIALAVEFQGGADDGWANIASTTPTNTMVSGTADEFSTTDVAYAQICIVDSDTVLVSYLDGSEGSRGSAIANNATDNQLDATWGTEVDVDGTDVMITSDCAVLEDNKAVIAYDNSTAGEAKAVIATLSGKTITLGSNATVGSGGGGVSNVEVVMIDSTQALVVYEDDGNSNLGTSVLLSISGTTITPGSEETWSSGAVGGDTAGTGIDIALISENKVAICYSDGADGSNGYCIIGDVAAGAPEATYSDAELRVKGGATLTIKSSKWLDTNFLSRIKITVQSSQVDSDLTDFPIYIDLNDLPAEFHENVNQTDARDIRVTKSDGLTEVPREVVFYTSGSDTGELHFKADGTLSSSTDTEFYIYYNNSGASDYAIDATYGAENVWTYYSGVFHNEDADPGTSVLDSTASSTDMTDVGSMDSNDSIAGKIGQGFDFDGTDDGLWASVSTFDSYPYVIEGWATSPASYASSHWIAGVNSYAAGSIKWVTAGMNTTGNLYAETAIAFVNSALAVSSGTHFSETVHVVAVFTSATSREIYVDGVSEGTNSTSKAAPFNTLLFNMGFARSVVFGDVAFWNGMIDEVRYSENDSITGATGSLGGANFIDAQYTNQNTPSTFYSVGSAEAAPIGGIIIK